MTIKLANNVSGFLNTAITASDTGIVLQSGNGASFPSLGAGEYFYATLVSIGNTLEVVKVTARSGDSMTVVRAQDGTSAASFAAGSRLEMRINAAAVRDAIGDVVASQVGFTPVGGIAATDVQAALAELDSEAAKLTTLAASGGSALVGFLQAGTGAVTRTAQSKMRDVVSAFDFMTAAQIASVQARDLNADVTAAVHAAIDAAKAVSGAVYFPAGKYRVTSGYTNSTIRGDVRFVGEGIDYAASNIGQVKTSCIVLDSTDPNSFFYWQSAANQLTVQDMAFACAQYVLDRKFFVASLGNNKHTFDNINFISVERPFVYLSGTYSQMNSYRNIRFTNSGSFHSETANLIATLVIIDNIDVEGTMPVNTAKIMCDLSGMRAVRGRNVLIEPAAPSTGWTALKLQNDYDADWTRFPTATFDGLWIEVTTNPLTYAVEQVGGRVRINGGNAGISASFPYRLTTKGSVEYADISFSGSLTDLASFFSLENYQCQVRFTNVNFRKADAAIIDPRFTFDNCSNAISGGAPQFIATAMDNTRSTPLWEFDGGYVDAGRMAFGLFGGTTYTPSTDTDFGRKLIIVPNAGAINAQFPAYARTCVPAGTQFWIAVRLKLPTFTGGSLEMPFRVNGTSIGGGRIFTSVDSGQEIYVVLPATTSTADPSTLGFSFNGTMTGSVGNLEIYQAGIYVGKSLLSASAPSYPARVQTFAAAAPITGAWAVGDRVFNSAPAIGQPKSWVCTVAGTPGTWVSEGNL